LTEWLTAGSPKVSTTENGVPVTSMERLKRRSPGEAHIVGEVARLPDDALIQCAQELKRRAHTARRILAGMKGL
jgi:hypothetical protein